MSTYVTRVSLDVNGTTIEDFNAFEEMEIVNAKDVKLMHKTGFANLTKRFKVTLDYVVPAVNPFDFFSFTEGTLHVVYDSGEEHIYSGVTTENVGNVTFNGEAEAIKKVLLICELKDGNRGDA
jgi:hypothetical protein